MKAVQISVPGSCSILNISPAANSIPLSLGKFESTQLNRATTIFKGQIPKLIAQAGSHLRWNWPCELLPVVDKSDQLSCYSIRPLEADDAESVSVLFLRAYEKSSTHACTNPDFLCLSMARGDRWMGALFEHSLVACSAVVWHPWMAIFEPCFGVTAPEHGSKGLGKKTMVALLRLMQQDQRFEMCIGFIHDKMIYMYRSTRR